jgi:hypothetical protein
LNESDTCRMPAATLRREPELLLHRQEAGLNDSIVSPEGGDSGCALRGVLTTTAYAGVARCHRTLRVDSTTVKAAAGDGGSGSTLVSPGAHLVSETAAAGTDLADYSASISCSTATLKTYGPGWVHVQSGDEVTCTITNTRLGKVEIAKVTDPHETGGTQFGFTGFAGAFNLADGGVKTITRVAPSSTPYAVTESAAGGYRLTSITWTDADSTGAVSTRTASIKVAARETVRCTFVNTKLLPGIEVVKSGPAVVHHADKMDFSFAVRSLGTTPLHDIKVSDDKCSPVSANPVTKAGGD